MTLHLISHHTKRQTKKRRTPRHISRRGPPRGGRGRKEKRECQQPRYSTPSRVFRPTTRNFGDVELLSRTSLGSARCIACVFIRWQGHSRRRARKEILRSTLKSERALLPNVHFIHTTFGCTSSHVHAEAAALSRSCPSSPNCKASWSTALVS